MGIAFRAFIDQIIDYAADRFGLALYDNGSMAAKKINALQKADFRASLLTDEANDAIKAITGAFKKT